MGLFKRKSDPISERARELNARIAALQAEIKRLNTQATPTEPPVAEEHRDIPQPPAAVAPTTPLAPQPPPKSSKAQPRLRSTALPHGPTINASSPAAAPTQEPIFEELDQDRLKKEPEKKPPKPPNLANELGMRKNGLVALLRRLQTQFRAPVTSNPKLVNYLAAGSIQGLRPLRYEKRIARNRFILLAGLLILLLWGIVAILVRHAR